MRAVFRIRVIAAFAALLCGPIGCGGSYGSAGAASLKLANSAKVGGYLVDGNGRALYYFGKDLPASGSNAAVSNCTGGCASAWPIFHAAGGAVQDISASDVGQITRSDGREQTTYRGWPLYYFAGDAKAGEINGEGVDEVWFVMHDQPYSVALMSSAAGQPQLYLSDGAGRSLYYFFRDTPGNATTQPVSACTAACLNSWPIFLAGDSVVPSTLPGSDFTVFTRPDGKQQSAYKGHPLYFFSGDATAGETKGRGVNNAWDTLDPKAL